MKTVENQIRDTLWQIRIHMKEENIKQDNIVYLSP
jgi:hypothetical protein